jgi:hypothetical protein
LGHGGQGDDGAHEKDIAVTVGRHRCMPWQCCVGRLTAWRARMPTRI